jgi:hypothetical protein
MIRSIKIDYKEIRRSTEAQSRHHKVYLKVYVFFFVKKKKNHMCMLHSVSQSNLGFHTRNNVIFLKSSSRMNAPQMAICPPTYVYTAIGVYIPA